MRMTESPPILPNRPRRHHFVREASVDPLSDVLRAVRLSGAHFYHVEAGPPWSVCTAAARELVPRVLSQSEHLISYHILLRGSCWGGIENEEQIQMQPGDVIMFPHGDAHLMASHDGLRLGPERDGAAQEHFAGTVRVGPDALRETELVCGFLGCDVRPYNPLLSSLPRRILVRNAANGWLAPFPQKVVAETREHRAGSETLLTRLAELMFIEVLRRYVEELPAQQTGWLAGLTDSVVGPAIVRLHEQPTHAWTLAELAQAIATSRTVLSERFTRLVGVSPMLYLTRWRLQLAAEQLATGSSKVAAIASRVGYDSESAFSRAFKRETGESPAAWRQARAAAG
jgi:AraC-like DNA-binding protein